MRRVLAGILCLCGLFLVSAVATAQDETKLIRISYSSGWDALPAIVGIERGFFDQEDVIASGVSPSSGEELVQSVLAGSTDLGVVPHRTFLALAAANAPIRAVAVNSWGTRMELVARQDGELEALSDLSGRTVALTRGSDALPVLMRLLNQAGIDPAEVKIIRLGANEITRALADGKADAVFDLGHYTTAVAGQGSTKVILSAADIRKRLGLVMALPVITSQSTIDSDRDAVQRATTGWIKSLLYIQQNPEDAARLLRIYLHRQGVRVPKDLADRWVGMERFDLYRWTDNAVKDAEYNAWGLKIAGKLGQVPDIAEFVDNRFVDASLQSLEMN